MISLFTRLLRGLGLGRTRTHESNGRSCPRAAGRRVGRHAASRRAHHTHRNSTAPATRPTAATPSPGTSAPTAVTGVVADIVSGAIVDAIPGLSAADVPVPASSHIHTAISGHVAAITTPEATLWLVNGTLRCADHHYPLAQIGAAIADLLTPGHRVRRSADQDDARLVPAA